MDLFENGFLKILAQLHNSGSNGSTEPFHYLSLPYFRMFSGHSPRRSSVGGGEGGGGGQGYPASYLAYQQGVGAAAAAQGYDLHPG